MGRKAFSKVPLALALQQQQPLTLSQLAEWLQTSERTICRLMTQGLPHFRVGAQPRFIVAEVTHWLSITQPELAQQSAGLHAKEQRLH